MDKISTTGQWAALNNSVHTLKILCLALAALLAASLAYTGYVATLPPVVIEKDGGARYASRRAEDDEPTTKDIEAFVGRFIEASYGLKTGKTKRAPNIRAFVTEDFFELADKRRQKEAGDVSQYVGNIRVSVTQEEITATFDRIIRIKGIPMVSPMQVSLQLLQEAPNESNPWGLYVNGMVVHEGGSR